MDDDDGATLIESAMSEVQVIECPMCEGAGKLKQGLDMTCPRCLGGGKTTNSGTPLSRWDRNWRMGSA